MSIVIAIIIFSIMILFHELGHFLLAKKNGIIVDEFSLGMGPRLLSFERGGTRYCLKLLPFGGSCMMRGEDGEDSGEGSFNHASVLGRISVVAAGPVFNFILAFAAALVVIGVVGFDIPEVIGFPENSPASEAGLKEGDVITSINGYHVAIGRDIYMYLTMDGLDGSPITLQIKRDGEEKEITYQPTAENRYMLGFSYSDEGDVAEIGSVTIGSPMHKAGLAAGDVILSINGTSISSGKELAVYMQENPLGSEAVEITYEHDGDEKTVMVTPKETVYTQEGFYYNTSRERGGIIQTIRYSFSEIVYWVRVTIKSLGMLFTQKVTVNDLSGPVGVVDAIGETYTESRSEGALMILMNMLNMIILLSVNLGIMNLIPFPALDGGRLVFLIIEGLRGKAVNRNVEGMVHFVGLVLLLVLIVYVTFHDVTKLL